MIGPQNRLLDGELLIRLRREIDYARGAGISFAVPWVRDLEALLKAAEDLEKQVEHSLAHASLTWDPCPACGRPPP